MMNVSKHGLCITLGFSLLALSACEGSSGQAPGAISDGEAQALEEAAQMLDERRLPEGTLPPTALPQVDEQIPQEQSPEDQADTEESTQ